MSARAGKLWGGRFTKGMDPLAERYTSSIAVDFRLAKYDVVGSIAHARMLGRCRIISQIDAKRLVDGLERIMHLIARNRLKPDPQAEDIHTQIELLLRKRIGPVADRLHTARSRNDQVALDMRLYCRDVIARLDERIGGLQRALVDLAGRHPDLVIPGYTHLQRAQPVLFAHHLLAYVEMLERDRTRLRDCYARADVLPLGAGALAGTSLPINCAYVAELLEFSRVAENSLDAVSDRDFAIELLADLSLVAVHLSRFGEDVVLWTTEEFGIVELDEAFATGSSLMPQKKNPDVLELVRGQAGLVAGGLVALLMVLKGLPLAYNRDLQWDKAALFHAVDLVEESLRVLDPLVRSMRPRPDRVARLLETDSLCATDLAEFLVSRGVPFRRAHGLVGRLVLRAEQTGRKLGQLSDQELQAVSAHFDGRVRALMDPRASVRRKASAGGTSPAAVRRALARWTKQLGPSRGRRDSARA